MHRRGGLRPAVPRGRARCGRRGCGPVRPWPATPRAKSGRSVRPDRRGGGRSPRRRGRRRRARPRGCPRQLRPPRGSTTRGRPGTCPPATARLTVATSRPSTSVDSTTTGADRRVDSATARAATSQADTGDDVGRPFMGLVELTPLATAEPRQCCSKSIGRQRNSKRLDNHAGVTRRHRSPGTIHLDGESVRSGVIEPRGSRPR